MLKAAQMQKTLKQIEEKILFRQREFGINVGRSSRSWRPTQKMKARENTKDRISSVIFVGDRMPEELPVIALYDL